MASPWPGTPYLPLIPNNTCLANTSGGAAPPIPLPYTTTGIPGPPGATGGVGPAGPAGATGAVGAAGPAGPQGPAGTAGYLASSPTSMTVGTGSQSFFTQASLAYTVGARIRLASRSAPTNFMEGICTAYNSSTGAMTAAFDVTGGAGTFADWDINIAGQRGATGATGPVGPFGSPIVVSDTAPATPSQGTLWWDSVGAQLYLWYVDANSAQWVIANSLPSGPPGPVGPVGVTGAAGPAGPTGAAGPVGATGAVGPVGPVGAAGPTGPAGQAVVQSISDTAPASPVVGQLWFDSVGSKLYMWYTDPTSSQWVPL